MKSDSDFHFASGKKANQPIEETRTQTSESPTDHLPESAQPGLPNCGLRPNDTIGRYVVIRELGTGGFGHVVLAKDLKLRRQVAIKFPRRDRVTTFLKNSFLEEGRSVARLDHPSIIRLYNIEETEDGIPFAVMEYVEGPTLQQVINSKGLTFSNAIEYLIQIARALEYAHGQTLIHRDLKPINIIVSQDGKTVKLMDFGLALHDLTPDELMTRNPVGTPPYMSPEQIRGENHRLDGRTDIWAFGVTMYVMLTGEKPFTGNNTPEMVNAICFDDPKAPREINRQVPPEFQRICLKCIEKLMGTRYQTVTQLLDDLRNFESYWQSAIDQDPEMNSSGVLPLIGSAPGTKSSSHQSASGTKASQFSETNVIKVVPKGLRSFDGQDAEFFVELLPGPKDRFGIPDSLRFWLSRISDDPNDPLTVGLVFGPSGCGKSSFVKAGLIPHLPNSIKTIYLEATPEDTEQKLLSRLKQVAPDAVQDGIGLAEALRRVRRGQTLTGTRLLVVIDQFEQWLHNNIDLTNQPLIDGLRQCDGEHLCCLLMIRDDFWMSATQFMAQLDLKVQEGVNALGIPLFDRRHARKVLAAYGRAFDAVDEELSQSQSNFISDAVAEIAEDGKIIPIHLSLFAQMTDSDSWDAAQLKRLGGWHGIGVHFLESIFSDKRKSRYEPICRAIMQQLLPDSASDIKGTHKSFIELAKATGQPENGAMLHEAIDFLDRELRIITPTESENGGDGGHEYQLTHDYLVRPIRTWLSQKARETWQGRGKIRLAELANQWQVKRENRFMPSPFAFVPMLFGVDRKTCTDNQRAFLRQASLFYGVRVAALAAAMIGLAIGAWSFWNSTNYQLAQDKFGSLLVAAPAEVSARLELLEPFGKETVATLIAAQPENSGNREKLHKLYARSYFGTRSDIPIEKLLSLIGTAEPGECSNMVDALRPLVSSSRESELFTTIRDQFEIAESYSLKIRLAVVALHLGNPSFASEILQFRPDPELREQFIEQYPDWHGRLTESIELLERADDSAFAIGLLKSLGQITRHQFSEQQYADLQRVANSIFQKAKTPGAHSAARWVMNQLEMNVPNDILRAPNGSWFIKQFNDSEKITFLKVEPQIVPVGSGLSESDQQLLRLKPDSAALDHSFYLSDQEVCASLFFRYLRTLEKDHPSRKYFEGKPISDLVDKNLPIFKVTWNEAVGFCNWLSVSDDRAPSYVWNTDESMWEPSTTGNGYRLATNLEWDAANRMGTTTRYFFGDTSSRMTRYAIVGNDEFPYSDIAVAMRGQKMPNDNGFFDMMGNANEWCQDIHIEADSDSTVRSTRGGHSMAAKLFLTSASTYPTNTVRRVLENGIRIVLDKE